MDIDKLIGLEPDPSDGPSMAPKLNPPPAPKLNLDLPPPAPKFDIGAVKVKVKKTSFSVNTKADYTDRTAYERTRRTVNLARALKRHADRQALEVSIEPEVYLTAPNPSWHWLLEDEQSPTDIELLLAKRRAPHAFRRKGISHMTTKAEYQLTALANARETLRVLDAQGWMIVRKP